MNLLSITKKFATEDEAVRASDPAKMAGWDSLRKVW